MKTQEVLEELRKKNVVIPKNWAVLQNGSGFFYGFMPIGTAEKVTEAGKKTIREMLEYLQIEKRAAIDSAARILR